MSEMDGLKCMIYPISRSSSGLCLYITDWDGAFVAFLSDKPFLDGDHHQMLDAEVVDTRKQAMEWFFKTVEGGEYNANIKSNTPYIGVVR
jgi:hypothetical protein